jgi:hypothetical protein
MESGSGLVSSLAAAVRAESIHGGWWARAREIFALSCAIRDSPDVLVCRLVEGKVSFVHRRLRPFPELAIGVENTAGRPGFSENRCATRFHERCVRLLGENRRQTSQRQPVAAKVSSPSRP